ncbi:hypothetical protein LEP1GSC133_1162 [Leptospira borgpetersenii serovar Pomona str. 200901868]|uniref:Uncharacterized protein n=1 Tax=Leptospira borgpetersenii serovar Pomona str. 200901868 TaxID=1192866 RepID=M6WAX7_LEPBO|nr:hypothetical protein LEP1GSC133_1162 [Leptospira borgpetersenii serovar Pomona str. 200901868]
MRSALNIGSFILITKKFKIKTEKKRRSQIEGRTISGYSI